MTTTPRRIQRRRLHGWRAADHCTNPNGYAYIGRGTRWGNPWAVVETRRGWIAKWLEGARKPTPAAADREIVCDSRYAAHEAAVYQYAAWIADQPTLLAAIREHLADRDVLCWCPPELPCHGDVHLAVAAGEDPRPTNRP